MIRRSSRYYLMLILALACQFHEAMAFPKNRSITPTAKFSRKRVILNDKDQQHDYSPSPISRTPMISPSFLVKMNSMMIGLLYTLAFFVFPERTLSPFFALADPSMHRFLKILVRVVAINRMGQVAELLKSPPEKSVRITTAFLTIGGAFVIIYYAQAKLKT
jgi:hypothetical protein